MVGPHLAIWGTFDVANFGDLLFPRIFEREIRARLPDATVRSFSPLGYLHPVPLDGGFVAEPLGDWTPERLSELAGDLDFVAIGGGEIIHPHDHLYGHWYEVDSQDAKGVEPSKFFVEGLGEDVEATTPVAWHSVGIPFDLEGDFGERVRRACAYRAYLSVRDETSRKRLHDAGVESEIHLVPDSALLVDRLFDPDLLERRRDYLRAIDAFPANGEPLVVQGSRALLPFVDEIGRRLAELQSARGPLPILLLEAGPCHGDDEFADALTQHLPPEHTYRLHEYVVVEDLVAAIAGSRGFVGLSLHGSLTAFVHGVPFSILNLVGYSKLDAFSASAGAEATLVSSPSELRDALDRVLDRRQPHAGLQPLVTRVDAHFDRIAELAERAASRQRSDASDGRPSGEAARRALEEAEQRYAVLRAAFDARGHRLLSERLRLIRAIDEAERGVAAFVRASELARARDEIRELREGLAGARDETRTLREELGSTQARLSSVEAELTRTLAAHDAAERELARVRATKVFRYSAPLRQAWARLRKPRS